MSRTDLAIYAVAVITWASVNLFFWQWWFQPDHIVTWPRFLLATIGLSYDLTLMPMVLIFFLYQMKRPVHVDPEQGLRVAMLTAIVPSAESIDVLELTVAGMVAVRYPHDNWVLDEGGDPRVKDLCSRYGVHYWSRKGIPEFNQSNWPFQAKTKSGNYNSWFNQIGYRDSEFVVQLDTDHVPVPEYLDEVLGYFRDPEVAYVALPSVYRNLEDWPTRGSSEQSQVFQGVMQMGYYGWAKTPMIIGSHAAYRVSHLKEIGGFGPSRAEDHLDTLVLAQHGHRGVFVPKVLAEGLGPHNLSDYLAQEHQWAFSIAQVLIKYGRQKRLLKARQRAVFLFSELWYSIYSTSYLLLFVLPLIALMVNEPIVQVPFIEFLEYSLPLTFVSISILAWTYRRHWLRPGTHFFMSWQGIVLSVARWPIVLIAIFSAVVSVVFQQGRFNYLVTPKGGRPLSTRTTLHTVAPFLILGSLSIGAAILYAVRRGDPHGNAAGYVLFALMSALFNILILIVAAVDFYRVNIKAGARRVRVFAKSTPILGATLLLVFGSFFSGSINRQQTKTALRSWPTTNATVTVAATSVTGGPPVVPVTSWLFDPTRTGVTFGAYDPSGGLSGISGINHYFIAWSDEANAGIPTARIRQSYADGQPVLLTVEPWPLDNRSGDTLLTDIADGQYDPVIHEMASTLASIQQPILIRFGHEMDMKGLYPWAQGDSNAFIAAYRHVIDVARADGASNVLWVWSPGGAVDSLDFYPGARYVDYVGISVLEYTRWELEIAKAAEPRLLSTLIQEKYDLLAPLEKPLILAEIGIDLNPALKQARIREMIFALPSFPKIRAVVYFNAQNPVNVMSPDQPQWTLSTFDLAILEDVFAESPWTEQRISLNQSPMTPADPLAPR
ncbi:MAG: glycosyltransferase family 2 protein [Nitrolancea sp.]